MLSSLKIGLASLCLRLLSVVEVMLDADGAYNKQAGLGFNWNSSVAVVVVMEPQLGVIVAK